MSSPIPTCLCSPWPHLLAHSPLLTVLLQPCLEAVPCCSQSRLSCFGPRVFALLSPLPRLLLLQVVPELAPKAQHISIQTSHLSYITRQTTSFSYHSWSFSSCFISHFSTSEYWLMYTCLLIDCCPQNVNSTKSRISLCPTWQPPCLEECQDMASAQ